MRSAASQHGLQVVLNLREGSLVRLLGLVERRGFVVTEVRALLDGDLFNVSLALRSERDLGTLCRQILRLVDVVSVTPREAT